LHEKKDESHEKKDEAQEKKEDIHDKKKESHEAHEKKDEAHELPEQQEIRLLKVPSGDLQPSDSKDSTFLYNEYVVFDEKQVKMNYLVKLKFNYK